MKILIVNPFYLPDSIGGGQLHIYYLARGLRRRGHAVHLLRRDADAEREDFEVRRDEFEGLPISALNYNFRDCTEFRFIYRNRQIDRVFERELDRIRPDIVHVHHLTCLSSGILEVCERRALPVVFTLHDFWMGCPRGQRIQEDLALCERIDRRRCVACCARLWPDFFPDEIRGLAAFEAYDRWILERLRRVDQLVAPSAFHASKFVEYGVPEERLEVVENGLPHEIFQGLRRVPAEEFRVAFIGSIIPSKGVHTLIEAFQRLEPHGDRLTIHGECLPWHLDTGYRERLEALLDSTHAITFAGRYENQRVPELLSSCDALVVPSLWYEAFCLTIREGFLAKVPVIAARLGAMAEAIEHGRTGLLFEPGDAADLAAQLERLRADPELRKSLAEAPKEVVSLDAMTDRLLALYHRALRGR